MQQQIKNHFYFKPYMLHEYRLCKSLGECLQVGPNALPLSFLPVNWKAQHLTAWFHPLPRFTKYSSFHKHIHLQTFLKNRCISNKMNVMQCPMQQIRNVVQFTEVSCISTTIMAILYR